MAMNGCKAVEYVILSTVDRYRLHEEVRIVQRMGFQGESWAVLRRGDVLNQAGEWEYEPMPSSRDDAFLERCRFQTPEAALQAYKKRKVEP